MTLAGIAVFAGAGAMAWVLTRALVVTLRNASVLDVPNSRSLHGSPTPRGGGLAIAAVVLTVQVSLVALAWLPAGAGAAAVLAGLGFALLGWFDDRADRSIALRLGLQFAICAAFLVVMLRGTADPGIDTVLFASVLLAVVWHVNLFNFMDGADGFAGTQAAVAAGGAAIVFVMTGHSALAMWALAMTGASAGFLFWNWHPARIFLGDTGSYFLGFEFAALAIFGVGEGMPIWPFLILSAPFVTDASLTLAGRIVMRRRWLQAHRDHAYQRLVLGGCTPSRLSVLHMIYLAGVCLPAAISAVHGANGRSLTMFVYGLTGMIWWWIRKRKTTPLS